MPAPITPICRAPPSIPVPAAMLLPRASAGSEWRARSRLATAAAPRLRVWRSASVRAFLGSRWRLVAAEVDREVRGWKRAGDHAPGWIELAIATAGNERAGRAVHVL